ncbi:MAG TPA: amino acid adenylation domain-containing protein [Pyrinomonadaceae bacterium]|nr:amino acid adenylation domain-containing protein [Pyrinomonadaceae bacterium]
MTEDVFVIPSSYAQQRLWLLERLEPGTAAFNMSAAVRLTGTLNVPALEQSLNEVVRRHESLRTTFAELDGEPVQTIASNAEVLLPIIELEDGDELERHIRQDAQTPFDLSEGPLLRTTLVRMSTNEHVLLLSMHHIVSDGWSIGVLIREVMSLYSAFVGGGHATLAELPIQYADFALWQRERINGEAGRAMITYWKRQLASPLPVLELPDDHARPAVQTYKGARQSTRLSPELSAALQRLGRAEGATLYMTLLAGFKTLLLRQTRQEDVIVGTPIAGRNQAGLENLIGFFVNTLVLRTDLSGNPTFRELLARVREVTLGAYAHQELPFEKLLEVVQPERSLSHTPLFQVYFNMLNFPATEIELPGLKAALLTPPEVESKFDLTVYVKEAADGIDCELVYNADLFSCERMAETLAQYVHLLEQIVERPDARLDEFSLVTPDATRVLPNPIAALSDKWLGSVPERFSAHARKAPFNLAVMDQHETWNYGDLDARSGQLARHLIAGGVVPGDRVAIYAHRSAPLVLALLGVFKAGAAFVILDPAYPAAHHIACLKVAQPSAWIQLEAAGELSPALAEHLDTAGIRCRVVLPRCALAEAPNLFAEYATEDPNIKLSPNDLAYVAFTSGSTGTPKGVLGRHGSLTHFLPWLQRTFGLDELDRFSLLSGIAHDPLHRDVFTPLQLGASICIPDPDDIPVPGRMAEWMKRENISIAHLTPAMGQLLTEGASADAVTSLRYIFLVGDVLTRRDVARMRSMAPAVTCINYYGSTETQRAVSYHVVSNEAVQGKEILPLGHGIEDVQLLVLTPANQLCGIGEPGEIFLRSPHIALGYLGDEALTRERFITNPFTGREGDTLYRTGDVGRYLPDGGVEPLGRRDFQVKIRGFRVELGEIEAVLGLHAGVREAVVITREDAGREKRLVGYVVPQEGDHRLEAELRSYLKERLPDYMVPSAFVILEALPLTPNGKVDRRSLPEPLLGSDADEPAAPRTPVEEVVAGVWSTVLGVERVGLNDNFFELGGHSLLATQVIARVRTAFRVEVPLRRIFETPTVAGMAAWIELALQSSSTSDAPPLEPTAHGTEHPLSFAQQRLWFLDQLEPGNAFYNVGAAVRLSGALDVEALDHALREIVQRHESLRTTFKQVDGEPMQFVASSAEAPFIVEDLSALALDEREAEARRRAAAELGRPFDLSRGPLLRVKLWRLDEREHVALVSMHHIISDGWSSGVFVREMVALYRAFSSGEQLPLSPLPLQYADYVVWQHGWLRGEVLERELDYWTRQLGGAPSLLELPTDRPRPAVFNYRGAKHHFTLSQKLFASLESLSRRESCTLFMTLLAAFNVLLYRYTEREDIVIGTPIAGRGHAETERLIGLFVNTLVLRTDLSGDPKFRDLLTRVREVTLGAYAHQDVPFEMLVDRLQPERSLSYTPLFQVALTLQNAPAEPLVAPELTTTPLEIDGGTAKFDLLLTMQETARGLECFFEYSTDLFDAATIERMSEHLRRLLEAVVADPDANIADLPLLQPAERHQLVYEWNEERTADMPALSLHQLFEEQAARTPNAAAVTFDAEQLTYGELNARANQLARHLRNAGVGTETLVGVYLERSALMVVGLLAVLKAGGAYVPLSPPQPKERLSFMLEDAGATVLLTERSLAAELSDLPCLAVFIDDEEAFARESGENLEHVSTPDNLAYVIYTSGSTGNPKGVQVTHGNVHRLFSATQHWFDFSATDVWTMFHSYAFDFSVWELWGALLYGGRLVVVPYWVSRSPEAFYELVHRERVTILNQTPSAFRHFIQVAQGAPADVRHALRAVIFGGEALELRSLLPWIEMFGDARPQLVNMYGITETTVHVTYQLLNEEHVRQAPGSLIGRPIPDLEVYVLDKRMQPAPVGVPGEMYVGGAGLARGYLNRPELTSERFVPDTFSTRGGARLYKTGDRARFRADGTLEYLGRVDHQVKIRGFRVEPGEIEAALAKHPGVAAALVMAIGEGESKNLVAYVASPNDLGVGELRAFLKERLPDYMIPHAFVILDALPLTPNGKVDRKSLLALERTKSEQDFVAARTRTEQVIAKIWSTVLGVEMVGANDNFFQLGGDSILSIQVVSRARLAGIRLTPRQIFQHQTVAELATIVDATSAAGDSYGAHGPVSGPVPLTPIQRWFFEQNFSDTHHYNQAVLLTTEPSLDYEMLEQAVAQLLTHHDALRLRYVRSEDGWQQINAVPDELSVGPYVERIDYSELPEDEQSTAIERAAAEMQAAFNLAHPPLLRVVLFELGANRPSRLFIVAHHLVIDGVSWRILLEDLQTCYEALTRGETPVLPAMTMSFKRWSERLEEYARSEELANETAYWLARRQSVSARLPVNDTPGPNTYTSAHTVTTRFAEDETRALLHEVPAARTQIDEVLLAALVRATGNWTRTYALLVDLEGHGREEIFDDADTSRTVGWFTSQYPVLLDVSGARDVSESLAAVKEQLRNVPHRGIGYGLLRYLRGDAKLVESLRGQEQAEIRFNYLGQFDQLLAGTRFSVAPESSGPAISLREQLPYLLEINARVAGGQLELSWRYSENALTRETIEALAADYSNELRGFLQHCREAANAPAPSDFPLARLKPETIAALVAEYGPVEDIYPLSPLQEGLLFRVLQGPQTDDYFLHLSCRIEGRLDTDAFARAWREVVARHTILRTAFLWSDLAEPLQVVKREVELPWEEADWRPLSDMDQRARLDEYLRDNRARAFDLTQPPTLRLALFRLAEEMHQLVWSSHHIALDGWSYPIIIKEVLTCYDALARSEEPHLPPARPYRDYLEWLHRQDLGTAEKFWRETLRGFDAPTSLGDNSAPPQSPPHETRGAERIRLSDEATDALRAFARSHRLTLNTLVQGAWALCLSGASGRDDVLFGFVVSGRTAELSGAETMVGLLINTLPLRVRLAGDESLVPWLKEVQARQSEAQQYDYSPLAEVQRWSEVPPGQPLFESFITFLNYPARDAVAEWSGSVRVRDIEFVEKVDYPLNLIASARNRLELELKYDARRFSLEAVKRMLALVGQLLEAFAARPNSTVEELRAIVREANRKRQEARQDGFRETRRRLLDSVKQKGRTKAAS